MTTTSPHDTQVICRASCDAMNGQRQRGQTCTVIARVGIHMCATVCLPAFEPAVTTCPVPCRDAHSRHERRRHRVSRHQRHSPPHCSRMATRSRCSRRSTDRSGAGASIGKLHGAGATVRRPCGLAGPSAEFPFNVLDVPPATAETCCKSRRVRRECSELIASGINPGQNTGHLVLHSGTVGGRAYRSRSRQYPGSRSASSTTSTAHYIWETAATFAAAAVRWVANPDDATPRVLNINVPNVPLDEVKGVREASTRRARRGVDRVRRTCRVAISSSSSKGRGEADAGYRCRAHQRRLRGRHTAGGHRPRTTTRRRRARPKRIATERLDANPAEQSGNPMQRSGERSVPALDSAVTDVGYSSQRHDVTRPLRFPSPEW